MVPFDNWCSCVPGGNSPFALPSALLGGVLNGETPPSKPSAPGSGASVARMLDSVECDLLGIFGFPARLTGGGTGGADAVGPPFFRGSVEDAIMVLDCKMGGCLGSIAGVETRLGILKGFAEFDAGKPGLGAGEPCIEEWGRAREGTGE